MKQFDDFGDDRNRGFCVFCGGSTETRDHIPSKVFLDEPYPANLPVVPACQSCNESFSLDEEYVACLIECSLSESVKPYEVGREKIKRILEEKPALVSKLSVTLQESLVGTFHSIEEERVKRIILKLARGHAAFELSEPKLDAPAMVTFIPFPSMSSYASQNFETLPKSYLWPEVGSRGMQRMTHKGAPAWIDVQSGRYRYLAFVNHDGETIRIVLSEYLASEVVWH